jgi:hypothetical protein
MDQIGLINKLFDNFSERWKSSQRISKLDVQKKHNELLSASLLILKETHSSKDLNLALGVEEMFLREELEKYDNSNEEIDSIKKAVSQVQQAKESLAVIQNSSVYKEATRTYSDKNKEAGLPLDSFRQFLKSHSTRLYNRMAGNLPVPEKNILRQRKENLGMVRDVYIAMQREALGLPQEISK